MREFFRLSGIRVRLLILPALVSSWLAGCSPQQISPPPDPTLPVLTSTITRFPPETQTHTFVPTATQTPTPPKVRTLDTAHFTDTPTQMDEPSRIPTNFLPSARIHGAVSAPNGDPIEGVEIFYALSSYPSGTLLAETNSLGQFEGFIHIPHEEVTRVWAVHANFTFKPGAGTKSWMNGEFAWHYYGGFEDVRLDFIGTPK